MALLRSNRIADKSKSEKRKKIQLEIEEWFAILANTCGGQQCLQPFGIPIERAAIRSPRQVTQRVQHGRRIVVVDCFVH